MAKIIFLIGAGGFIGSVLRYLTQLFCNRHIILAFPVGTFLVNVVGSFLIGLLLGEITRAPVLSQDWRFFLATGLCGGFTTFSTFSYESVLMLKEGNYLNALLYIGGSLFLSLLATFAGISLPQILSKN